ncbi:hypothetical protein KCP75_03375 [Salmonella enterica subsp. enterica]|nr:hypothetical protein KCP75_03375 [Salmonella enterica subsp. enterica]
MTASPAVTNTGIIRSGSTTCPFMCRADGRGIRRRIDLKAAATCLTAVMLVPLHSPDHTFNGCRLRAKRAFHRL